MGPNELTPPPLVLLHAFPFDHRLFASLGTLPTQTFSPDFRGFGERELVHHDGLVPHPSLDVLADDVVALLDNYGIERAVVGGVSLGGYVALILLSRYPERLAGLILADTKADADTDDARANRLAMAENAEAGQMRTGHEVVAGLISEQTGRESPEVVELLALYAAAQTPAAVSWAQRAMADRGDSFAVLAECTVPVLVIVGSADPVTGVDRAQAMADAAPDSTLVVIEGAGHLTPAEAPAQFTNAIVEWWSSSLL